MLVTRRSKTRPAGSFEGHSSETPEHSCHKLMNFIPGGVSTTCGNPIHPYYRFIYDSPISKRTICHGATVGRLTDLHRLPILDVLIFCTTSSLFFLCLD